ncbi:unnamed protein product, partial [Prorocentrum cordatum]
MWACVCVRVCAIGALTPQERQRTTRTLHPPPRKQGLGPSRRHATAPRAKRLPLRPSAPPAKSVGSLCSAARRMHHPPTATPSEPGSDVDAALPHWAPLDPGAAGHAPGPALHERAAPSTATSLDSDSEQSSSPAASEPCWEEASSSSTPRQEPSRGASAPSTPLGARARPAPATGPAGGAAPRTPLVSRGALVPALNLPGAPRGPRVRSTGAAAAPA